MNKLRRKNLRDVMEQIETLSKRVVDLEAEEQEYYDSMPENMRYGVMGNETEAVIENLAEAVNNLDEAVKNIETAMK